jgi:hypothetical protein
MLHQDLEYPCWVSFCFIFLSVMLFSTGFRWPTFQSYIIHGLNILSLSSHEGYIHSVKIHYTDHLPTYILFDKATEVARFPEIGNATKVFVPKVTKVYFPHFLLYLH